MPSTSVMPCSRQIATAFPPSVTEPPPTITNRSAEASRAALAQATTAERGECDRHAVVCADVACTKGLAYALDFIGLTIEGAAGEEKDARCLQPIGLLDNGLRSGLPKMTRFICVKIICPDCIVSRLLRCALPHIPQPQSGEISNLRSHPDCSMA